MLVVGADPTVTAYEIEVRPATGSNESADVILAENHTI